MASISPCSCRLCLNIPPTDTLVFSVFDTYQGIVLSQLIDELFKIQVRTILEDDQQLSLCIECVNRINTVHKIKQLFVANDRKLRELQQANRPTANTFVEELVYSLFTPNEVENTDTEKVPLGNAGVAEQRNVSEEVGTTESVYSPSPDADTFDVEAAELYCDTDHQQSSVTEQYQTAVKQERPVNGNNKIDTAIKLPQNKCYFCGAVFENSLKFTNHLPAHFNAVPYTCAECDGLVFRTVREASKHIGLHDERERPFKCTLCALRFPSLINRQVHVRKTHRFKLRQMAAKASSKKQAPARRSVDRKRKVDPSKSAATPQRELLHECEICGKKFTAKKNLTRHLMIHTGEKPFKCDQCDRTYRQSGELKRHRNNTHRTLAQPNGSINSVPDGTKCSNK
uniref:Protein krueppel n=1 Tax=Anopheles epiroticus TaxID=199890 RepID=A0A182PK50_9DIPT